ncbi:uncharacterized protein HD556DRAFT_1320405 [Suillus plorans]|uniref:Secreted protein n=1 Tax=Suillus plorans TaxID=116603 RepID=A0A9P7E4D9_9AGAM|nr:uncharacterized protein HD556DRAFT_1320405 [Suillus plorans]KAG1810432.1 hypothetical protein HD556DRAFT_1320405 [Suillus plorans]
MQSGSAMSLVSGALIQLRSVWLAFDCGSRNSQSANGAVLCSVSEGDVESIHPHPKNKSAIASVRKAGGRQMMITLTSCQ